MNKKRFYFAIKGANVLECIWADSFTEAKQIASYDWMPYWSQIEWLDITTEPAITTLPVTIND